MTTATQPVRIVHSPVLGADQATLVVVDANRRTYLGLSRGGEYWHCIRPARKEDPVVQDGKVAAGALSCSCPAGAFARRCYWTQLAEALEKGDQGFVIDRPTVDEEIPSWLADAAPGEIVEVLGR